ncbi:MAG: RdgB/HAM1 family non-canonical purine NTP pyrophosphatase [Bryobacteraceae bacterium]
MIVYLCSSNRGKLKELSLAAEGTGLDVQPLPGLKEIAPPEETGSTFEENALQKALYYSQFTSEMVIADDSGLEVDALGGAPGVLSARFAGSDADDAENNALLLELMRNEERRRCRFVCVVVGARAGERLFTARGQTEGTILREPQGENGFGYDPLFFYPPLTRSFAELTPAEKVTVSHRGKAMAQLLPLLRTSELT